MTPYALTYRLPRESGSHFKTPVLGEAERLLTLPEISAVRRRYDAADVGERSPWNLAYLTSSLEYRGVTPGGVEVIAVRHGAGPSQADLDTDRFAFRRLLDGAFGDVSIVENKTVAFWRRSRRYGSDHHLNPLAVARFGGEDETASFFKQASFQRGRRGTHRSLPFAAFGGDAERESFSNPNGHVENLVVSEMLRAYDDRILCSLQSYPHLGTIHAAVTSDDGFVDIAPPVSAFDIAADKARVGWVADGWETADDLVRVVDYEGVLMTDVNLVRPKGFDEFTWPEFAVDSFKPVGSPIRIKRNGFEQRVRKKKAGKVDCYRIVKHDWYNVEVQYGRGVIDRTFRVPSFWELVHDRDIQIAATRSGAERWWRAKNAADRVNERTSTP